MSYLDVPYFKQDTGYTCGPTSLQMALAYYGIHRSEKNLAEELKTTSEYGTRHGSMIQGVLSHGLYCYVNEGATIDELRYLLNYKIPIIVWFLEPTDNSDHYGVVVGINRYFVSIHNPWTKPRERHFIPNFERRWTSDKLSNCDRWFMAISDKPLPFGKQYYPHDHTE
jgi:ABC-type bacteriocin/lantibiotic exporter with double-glycine peptidase domain